jgi:cell division protein FtsQ
VPGWLAATGVAAWLTFHGSTVLLDRPIEALEIEGAFQRVVPEKIEGVLRPEIGSGFLTVDLDALRARIESLEWVDRAHVRRRWPSVLHVTVIEQEPAARWGSSGLLNTRGELFVTEPRDVPAELPELVGPQGSHRTVASRYLALREELAARGLTLASVKLDARGAWTFRMGNGVEVRLGRRDIDARLERFVDALGTILGPQLADIEYVDMRYSNGFSVGWTRDALARGAAAEGAGNG